MSQQQPSDLSATEEHGNPCPNCERLRIEVERLRSVCKDKTFLLREDAQVERLRTVSQFLWRLLDDIDTASDAAKTDDKGYRNMVEKIQRRRFEVGSTDGYTVAFRS